MNCYSMSFGMNKPLVDFVAQDDFDAQIKAMNENADYCVKVKGLGRGSLYTVLDMGWNK